MRKSIPPKAKIKSLKDINNTKYIPGRQVFCTLQSVSKKRRNLDRYYSWIL